MMAEDEKRLASLPAVPEDLTYQQAKDLVTQVTGILLKQTVAAVEAVKAANGIDTAEDLRAKVGSSII